MDEVTYFADDMELVVLPYGATVKSLKVRVGAEWREVVLGFRSAEEYRHDKTYQGCVVGRLVNRVRDARFSHGGRTYVLPANDGSTNLHGGQDGLSRQTWTMTLRRTVRDPITMTYVSPAGQGGFPGNLHVDVRFVLCKPATLRIEYTATVDAPCPVDLTHHLYFNLGSVSDRDLRRHRLQIEADFIQQLDETFCAKDSLMKVEGTPFDLRHSTEIGGLIDRAAVPGHGFVNGSWCVRSCLTNRCILTSPDDALTLNLQSDQPCIQVYTGVDADFFPGGGIALEPQGYVDAVTFSHFPSPWLYPGETFRRVAVYAFNAK